MTSRQLIWSEGDAWFGQQNEGLAYRIAAREGTAPPGSVCPMLAPRAAGGPLLWLDAQGRLSGPDLVGGMSGLAGAAADPWLLALAGYDNVLRLVTENMCTSLDLPAIPARMAALGPRDGGPALSILELPDGVHGLIWHEGHISVQRLCAARAREVHLLAGVPPLAAIRVLSWPADRLLLYQHRTAPWSGWAPLPTLLLPSDVPSRLRQTDLGPCVRIGPGIWLRYQNDVWREVALLEQEGVSTLRIGRFASWDIEPWAQKQPIPSAWKLAVGRRRQGNQEPIAQENSSQHLGAFERTSDHR